MNIIDLIQADGFTLKRQATTNGGEYAGPCPFCGEGKDRFRVWPEQKNGRYWCRSCGKTGDSIQYLRERRGISFVEACNILDHDPGPRLNITRPMPAAWTPRKAITPNEAWQAKARAFLDGAIGCLWSPKGDVMRQWLHDVKGLSDDSIKVSGLGYNLTDIYESRGTWGLEASLKDNGTEKKQWIPAGLIIPYIVGGQVLRLRIRRDEPGDGSRYIVVSGSSMEPMAWGQDKAAAVIVESELDGLLLNQEAGDLCGVIAMGTATAKPDTATHEALNAAAVILISLDADDAGIKSSWQFWPEIYGTKAKRWPCINGKDPSEARLNGLDLRAWVVAGIFRTEERFERFCIQTIDGGLSDAEAIKAEGGAK